MKEKSTTVRYLGHQTLADGGRGFSFSVTSVGEEEGAVICVDAPAALFNGPDRIALQEGAGICYETLRSRIVTDATAPGRRFCLTSTDVAQHRKVVRSPGRRP